MRQSDFCVGTVSIGRILGITARPTRPSKAYWPDEGSSRLRPLWRTLLTVLTVFSRDELMVITLFPAWPSRRKVISIPSARREVCARRKCPARARGLFGQRAISLELSLLR